MKNPFGNSFFGQFPKGQVFFLKKIISVPFVCISNLMSVPFVCKILQIHKNPYQNFKSLYRALEWSYGAKNMWNRESLKNRNFLHWQPLPYDVYFFLKTPKHKHHKSIFFRKNRKKSNFFHFFHKFFVLIL